jgi:L-lactate dehydrogenase complex protein LldF
MSESASSFIAKSNIKAGDLEHRKKINFNIGKYNAVVPVGKTQFSDVMLAREKAKQTKWKAIEHLDKYLEQFEIEITKRGAKVLWAEDAKQALEHVGRIW